MSDRAAARHAGPSGWGALASSLLQDFRYGLLMARRSPGVSSFAIATLALGIGIGSAIVGIAHDLLRPLAFPAPERLRAVVAERSGTGERLRWSWNDLGRLQARVGSFEAVAGYEYYSEYGWTSGPGVASQHLALVPVSDNFFATLGVSPAFGRSFVPEEHRLSLVRPVVLSHRLWLSRFGGRGDVLGRTFGVDTWRALVVGVMPQGFDFLRTREPELYVPLMWRPEVPNFGRDRIMQLLARLRPGMSAQQAEAELRVVAAAAAAEEPAATARAHVRLAGLHEHLFGSRRTPFPLLLGAAALMLLTACASVATLLLSRAATREREVALRSAVGASRGRIVRQLVVEHLVLALLGGALGLALSRACLAWFDAFARASGLGVPSTHVDAVVVLCALALCGATSVLFGLAPALHLAGREGRASSALRGVRGLFVRQPDARRLSAVLVAVEVALSLTLAISTGLLLASVRRLDDAPLGFSAGRVVTVEIGQIAQDSPRFTDSSVWPRLLARLAGATGVESAALADSFPGSLRPEAVRPVRVTVEGGTLPAGESVTVENPEVSPAYFRALGIPLVDGRAFDDADMPGAEPYSATPVAIVNECFAREQWPGQAAVGRRITDRRGTALAVVGVVGDVRQYGARQGGCTRQMYTPLWYANFFKYQARHLVVRTGIPPEQVAAVVQAAVQGLDPDRPVLRVRTVDEVMRQTTAWDRLETAVLALFATLALILTWTGLWGTVARVVAGRTREIGIRIALGSRPGDVLRLVVRQALAAVLAGVVLGLPGAWLVSRLLANQLYGVGPGEWSIYAVGSLLLLAVSAAACFLPARRATSVDPTLALRAE